jgi:adenine-specific DNA-methyltransferase
MTELIWDGKYKDGRMQGPVRIALPFQTIETVNESAQDRRRNLELFASGRDTEWRNRLIWGDKKYVLPSLLPEFVGNVNLIYIDPPFDTGADFSFVATIPDHVESDVDERTVFTKEASVLEQKAYRDTWGRGLDSYLEWFYETVLLLRELLTEDGSVFVHLDWHLGHYAKCIMDEVFGAEHFRNEIIREKTNPKNYTRWGFGNVHDTLYFYSKSESFKWEKPYAERDLRKIEMDFPLVDASGRRYKTAPLHAAGIRKGETGKEWRGLMPPLGNHWRYVRETLEHLDREGRIEWSSTGNPREKIFADESPGIFLQDIWLALKDPKEEYPSAKNPELIERMVRACSHEGDIVLDCFVGSGTTAVLAERLRRRWIACDLSRFAIHTTRKQLLGIPSLRPFVVQNLGKYERQEWQVAEFPANGQNRLEEQREREAAYRNFILDLYHAEPISGHTWLHGAKAGRMVHVGAVDAPVTLADVKAIARETWKAVGTGKDAPTKAGVDTLGWEFAFEVNELAKQVAAESRVDVAFKKIPREVLDKKAVEQGDVKFFELGALSVDVKQKGREVSLKLTDFVIPTDDIPDEARKAIKHWSQLIDYWAVDWDYKSDTFHNQWQAYRTRKDPKISLDVSYLYPQGGEYAIVVKVIDILGNDTTKTVQVQVKQTEEERHG